MKKNLLLVLIVLVYTDVVAQLNINENFSGMNPGNLGGQNSWIGGLNDVQVNVLTNNLGAITYPGYTSGTNYITVNDIAGADPVKQFVSNVGIGANSTTYISFLVKAPGSASVTPGEDDALPSLALRTTLGNNLCYFYIANSGGTSPELKFGISKSENGTGNGIFGTTNYSFGDVYLIVIRYSLNTGADNDVMALFVNPTLTSSGPSGSSFTVGAGSDGGYSGALSSLQLFQSRVTSGFNTYYTPEVGFDAFRVATGTTFADAWTNLSPIGTILPVTITSITAYEKQRGIQLDWTVHSEINLSHYEIERSSGNGNFSTIGQVNALNTSTSKQYTFFDANPLPGTSFYRLKSVDYDAKNKYSHVLRVSVDNSIKDIRLYPNPIVNNTVSVQSSVLPKGNFLIEFYNADGKQIYVTSFSHAGGSVNQTIFLPASITKGFYIMNLIHEKKMLLSKKVLVK